MKNSIPPITHTDKLCLIALAGILIAATLLQTLIDGAPTRAADSVDADKPPSVAITAPLIDPTPLAEAVESRREFETDIPEEQDTEWDENWYREDVPLSRELQRALWETCEEQGVPVSLALGLIEVESGFQADLVSSKGAYGLCQLNPKYFPPDLSPVDNIRAGVGWFGELLGEYNDTKAALRAYNKGWDDGDRVFSNAVLAAAEKWGS